MGLGAMVGVTQKAILEIADFSGKTPSYVDAAKPAAGVGSLTGKGDFSASVVDKVKSQVMEGAKGSLGKAGFENFGQIHRYRYEVLFNPEELSITGYGGEEVPTQDFRRKPDKPPEPKDPDGEGGKGRRNGPPHGFPGPSSRMAASNTRIDMSVRFVIDRTNNMDAFYGDKFTLGASSIVQGAGTLAKNLSVGAYNKAKGKKAVNTVQADVEALSALARDRTKRLARFVWGDMIYEGLINSVSADYVMFNVNGEPCRANVTINMVLFDNDELPSSKSLWQNRYIECFNPKAKGTVDELAAHL